jgi:hypothetical protein
MSEALSLRMDQGAVRQHRSDKGSVRLTERDLASLHWIGEQYAIRVDQLTRLLGREAGRPLSDSTARAAVARWLRAGLAKRRKITAGDPAFVWLTTRGLREVGLSFKGWEPTAATVAHVFWTNQVRLYVEERHPEFSWLSERHLRAGSAMQTFSDERTHVADAELRSGDTSVAVEVELTAKSTPRREAIMRALANAYPTVWYFAPADVERALHRTTERLDASRERIRIYPLERVT